MEIHYINRGERDKSQINGRDFSGVYHTVRFSVNQDIRIKGLKFFGLHPDSEGSKCVVSLEMKKSMYSNSIQLGDNGILLSRKIYLKDVEPKKEFVIRFSEEIKIPCGMIVDLSFSLDRFSEDKPMLFYGMKKGTLLSYKEITEQESNTIFTFFSSSSQIQGIYFRVN